MPTAKNIAFISPRFSEQGTVGGAETLLKKLAEHAAAAGRKVTFLTTCARNHFSWANDVPPGRRLAEMAVVADDPMHFGARKAQRNRQRRHEIGRNVAVRFLNLVQDRQKRVRAAAVTTDDRCQSVSFLNFHEQAP